MRKPSKGTTDRKFETKLQEAQSSLPNEDKRRRMGVSISAYNRGQKGSIYLKIKYPEQETIQLATGIEVEAGQLIPDRFEVDGDRLKTERLRQIRGQIIAIVTRLEVAGLPVDLKQVRNEVSGRDRAQPPTLLEAIERHYQVRYAPFIEGKTKHSWQK
ncbi:hypothetical protein BWI97_18360 [Siphonobacter sp. BAB-5405]|uniref:hypothetical protein n=1 Tax=Siphonobacter sp. BAB-5405 TaxID=1864825 RepID=UPI000C80D31F|nr:hypothetical protein [Siphonobacter sp. BAB-5405]PMD93556.1 hypothetical protein BWI97_18360 [Siphonobacter sp. BAB-5405]